MRDETSESSTDETEDLPEPQYRGSIPRLIITLDRENNQLQEDFSPETPGCPFELKDACIPPPQIPIFAFTCEDVDAENSRDTPLQDTHVPMDIPPPVLDPPANYDLSSESGEAICLPPEMKPINTKLTLDLFNSRAKEDDYRGRCTGVDECVSACECCRTPQPETQPIPFIDEPNSEPVIFESDGKGRKVATPKIRRILPSLSLDNPDDRKPKTADATCQTPSSPLKPEPKPRVKSKKDLNLNLKRECNDIDKIHSRLRKTLFSVSKSLSTKSDDTEGPSISTSDSVDELSNDVAQVRKVSSNPVDIGVMLDNVDRKSWKSPDEYRPAFGKVKALAKHFNQINLTYCVKTYKRNCQSSPNLSGGVKREMCKTNNLPTSASLANIQYEHDKTDTTTKSDRLSEDEVKSILIQLEDWSKFGSRGSEDTLAQGNEFEIPNLPSEDHTDPNVSTTGSCVFTEIVDRKPKTITLDKIILKSNHSSENSKQTDQSAALLVKSDSLRDIRECVSNKIYVAMDRKHVSSVDISGSVSDARTSESEWVVSVQSCPDVSGACELHSRSLRSAGSPPPPRSCKPTHTSSMK